MANDKECMIYYIKKASIYTLTWKINKIKKYF